MQSKSSRRQRMRNTATASLTPLLPKDVFSQGPAAQSAVVRPGIEIGVVRAELRGHFAEHLGSCVYGGLWVGENSKIPNVDRYRKAAVDALRKLGNPVLRCPGGCFADNYHWRDGIGPEVYISPFISGRRKGYLKKPPCEMAANPSSS